MVIVWWPKYARVSRSLVLVQRSQEYVEAARALGNRPRRIPCAMSCERARPPRHAPHADIGNAIITFAGLTFLGLGIRPPTPEWGAMVSEGRVLIEQWWVSTFPGLAISRRRWVQLPGRWNSRLADHGRSGIDRPADERISLPRRALLEQLTGDDHPLNFVRALVNLRHLGVTIEALHF